jgi:hypothetical protein
MMGLVLNVFYVRRRVFMGGSVFGQSHAELARSEPTQTSADELKTRLRTQQAMVISTRSRVPALPLVQYRYRGIVGMRTTQY